VLNDHPDLRAVLMEVSFPSDQQDLATVSGHHTPTTLRSELRKLTTKDVPFLLYHIKPVFYAPVVKELAKITKHDVTILQLEDHFVL
jgi:3',5'-cyclic-nucleotide phosphodiesterase